MLQNFPLNKILQLADFCNFVIITFLPRNLLLRKILRKYAMRKVPNMRMAESRAVFACGWSPCASASSWPVRTRCRCVSNRRCIRRDALAPAAVHTDVPRAVHLPASRGGVLRAQGPARPQRVVPASLGAALSPVLAQLLNCSIYQRRSHLGRWRLREFNELEHFFALRLSAGGRPQPRRLALIAASRSCACCRALRRAAPVAAGRHRRPGTPAARLRAA